MLTRRGLFALAASAAAARKLPVMVPPLPALLPAQVAAYRMFDSETTYSNRLATPFVLTRESLQAMRDEIARMDLLSHNVFFRG